MIQKIQNVLYYIPKLCCQRGDKPAIQYTISKVARFNTREKNREQNWSWKQKKTVRTMTFRRSVSHNKESPEAKIPTKVTDDAPREDKKECESWKQKSVRTNPFCRLASHTIVSGLEPMTSRLNMIASLIRGRRGHWLDAGG